MRKIEMPSVAVKDKDRGNNTQKCSGVGEIDRSKFRRKWYRLVLL